MFHPDSAFEHHFAVHLPTVVVELIEMQQDDDKFGSLEYQRTADERRKGLQGHASFGNTTKWFSPKKR